MPSAITLKSVLEEVVQQTGLGYVVPNIDVTSITTTTITLTDGYLEGPFSGAKFPVGAPLKVTSPSTGGVATASSTTTITDSAATWVASEWIGFVVYMGGRRATITANTGTQLTFSALAAAPTVGPYRIELPDTYVSNYNTTTGVLTVNPAFPAALNAAQVRSASAIILYPDSGLDHLDRVRECVHRAQDWRLHRWKRVPLTFVPDGDLMGATGNNEPHTLVTDYWTGSNATPSYVTPTWPAGGAVASYDTFPHEVVLQSVTTGATNYVKSNNIQLALNSTTQAYQWYVQTAIRVVSGAGNAQIRAWDETNNAEIPVNMIFGDNQTQATTSPGFINMEFTLNIPTTCGLLSFRLISSATATTIQMCPIVAKPYDALTYPLPNRIPSHEHIGNFYYAMPLGGTSGPYNVLWTPPITTGGLTHSIQNVGDHYTVSFNFRALRPVYYDEYCGDNKMEAMGDTTTFALDRVVKWTKYELYKLLYSREKRVRLETGAPVPSQWKPKVTEALREAGRSEYEPDMLQVHGRT